MKNDIMYLGVRGSVVAFEKLSGKEIWRRHLKGAAFVTLAIDEKEIFAHTGGHLFCVDKETGRELWSNGLKGLGYGLGMIAIDSANASNAAMVQQIQAQQAAAGTAVAAANIAAHSRGNV